MLPRLKESTFFFRKDRLLVDLEPLTATGEEGEIQRSPERRFGLALSCGRSNQDSSVSIVRDGGGTHPKILKACRLSGLYRCQAPDYPVPGKRRVDRSVQ